MSIVRRIAGWFTRSTSRRDDADPRSRSTLTPSAEDTARAHLQPQGWQPPPSL